MFQAVVSKVTVLPCENMSEQKAGDSFMRLLVTV